MEITKIPGLRTHCALFYNDFVIKDFHNKIIIAMNKIISGESKRLILELSPRAGKLCADSTLVPTIEGFKRHGDLKVGDLVFNIDGEATRVVAVGKKDIANYEVSISDGSKVLVHGEHEWEVIFNGNRKIFTTKEMLERGLYYINNKKTKNRDFRYQYKFKLENISAVKFKEQELEIDPYVLGVWLGDGTKDKGCITMSKEDIENIEKEFKKRGYKNTTTFIHKITNVYTKNFEKNGKTLYLILKDNGFKNNKNIPNKYIYNSLENRKELLRGLIDSDGFIIKGDGRVKFSNTNLDIIKQLQILVNSLGYNARILNKGRGKEHYINGNLIKSNKDCYELVFNFDGKFKICYLKRKLNNLENKRIQVKAIIGIKEVEGEQGNCIQIEDKRGIYLITDKFIPTHNSLLCQLFISYYLGIVSNKDIIYAGHTLSLLQNFSRNIRNIVSSGMYKKYYNKTMLEGNEGVNSWGTSDGNKFNIFGIGGGITGVGFDIGIIDDPYSGREDVESETIRNKVYDWYKSTFYARRQNQDSAIILIMQRWREDDLVGQILEKEENNWDRVKLPAIVDGKSFWEEKFSIDELYDIREKIGDYFFQSQYMQDPINKEGGTFVEDMFRYYSPSDIKLEELQIVCAIDPAISQKQTADYTAIVVLGADKKNNNIYVLDIFRKRVEPDELINNLFRLVDKYHPIKTGVEVVAYQKALALEIRKQMNIKGKYFYLEDIKPMGEKEARIRASILPRLSNSNIYFNKLDPNTRELELELLKFPNGKHDDICDCLGTAITLLYTYNNDSKEENFYTDYSKEI